MARIDYSGSANCWVGIRFIRIQISSSTPRPLWPPLAPGPIDYLYHFGHFDHLDYLRPPRPPGPGPHNEHSESSATAIFCVYSKFTFASMVRDETVRHGAPQTIASMVSKSTSVPITFVSTVRYELTVDTIYFVVHHVAPPFRPLPWTQR